MIRRSFLINHIKVEKEKSPLSYINFGKKTVNISDQKEVAKSYEDGFVCVRNEKGGMEKVRSVRVDLNKFEASSENRRILKKYSHHLEVNELPYKNYSWEILKIGKDFYDTKFGKDTFSSNKLKEIFTTSETNFNSVLTYKSEHIDGYCICYISEQEGIVHYAYPFYKLELVNTSFGMFMMTKAIEYFKLKGFKYIYLGSAHDAKSLYKFQFRGIEWFDEKSNSWSNNIDAIKSILTE